MNKYEEAKRIYFAYNGNYFFMDRGDYPLLEKYKSFNVPKELEKKWSEEIKIKLIYNINNEQDLNEVEFNIYKLLDIVKNTCDFNRFILIYELLKNKKIFYDSFTKMRIIEDIFDGFIMFYKIDKEKVEKICKDCLQILKEIELNPILLSKEHKSFSEEEIRERIKIKLIEFTQIYNEREQKLIEYNKMLETVEKIKKQ